MYNSTTERKIKDIPDIADIDINRLPQELTKIYAQIVSLKRQVADGTLNFQSEILISGLKLLRKLANNLETILLTIPDHEQKESIAFVAATANNLIHKMGLDDEEHENLLETDSISAYIASIILFLIGNSQADAAETALSLRRSDAEGPTHRKLISCIICLATGKVAEIAENTLIEEEIFNADDLEETALNYLWREIGLGMVQIGQRLALQSTGERQNHFDKVIELSISDIGRFEQRSTFSGPYRLAKLLKLLEEDILTRAVINIPPPFGVSPVLWTNFLENLAKERPYLWENHKDVISTDFLDPGQSAVLTLPTGAGKSTLSELKIASCLYSGRKVIYLVPTHALEDQVNKNLRPLFSEFESVNIEFGSEFTDFEEVVGFPIVVMTPERCLTFLNINPDFFSRVGLVVFDEFHLIHGTNINKDRRSVDAMYCLLSIFNLAPQADYLLISAMVENGSEIASWISEVTLRKCHVFSSTWKPTRQLHGCLIFEERKIKELNGIINEHRKTATTKAPPAKLKNRMIIDPFCFFSLKNIWETEDDNDYLKSQILSHSTLLGIGDRWQLTSNRNFIAADLAVHFSSLGLKTLVFVDDPRITNSTSRKIAEALTDRHNSYHDYIKINQQLVDGITLELGDFRHSYFYDCKNVGVHHGLLLPTERSLIEGYFKSTEGSVVLVATATLAQGINLPAEIVIIAGDDRYDEDGENRQQVDPHELLNAAGRAGRAGLSSQGAVILIPGKIVTIQDSTISERWWQLKDDVFSKGDQCLTIKDPLEYFLDTIQENKDDLSVDQKNILYRFVPENVSHTASKDLLEKSLYAYKATIQGNKAQFDEQVRKLLDRRNELDSLTDEYLWQKEIAIKTGVEPLIIHELGNAIDRGGLENLLSRSVIELIEWFFTWIKDNPSFLLKIFSKHTTLEQIKKVLGLKPEAEISDITNRIDLMKDILQHYVLGIPLNELDAKIPNVNRPDRSAYLGKARKFVNRLVPELSFGLGLLSMVLLEKAKQNSIENANISWDVRILASCVREGFDSASKLFYKKDNNLLMRVETHLAFSQSLRL